MRAILAFFVLAVLGSVLAYAGEAAPVAPVAPAAPGAPTAPGVAPAPTELPVYKHEVLKFEYANCADLAKFPLPKKYARLEDDPIYKAARKRTSGVIVFTEGRMMTTSDKLRSGKVLFGSSNGVTPPVIITEINDVTMKDHATLSDTISKLKGGDTIKFQFLHLARMGLSTKDWKTKKETESFLYPETK